MDFPLSQAFRHYLEGSGKLREIYSIFAQDFLYSDTDNLMIFFDNHDMARGILIAKSNVSKIKQVMTMLLTTRGIPQLLYGTEINIKGGKSHVDLRADFPGGFPGHKRNAFTETGRIQAQNEIFSYLRKLLHLRKTHKALTLGKMAHYPPSFDSDVYKYLRIGEDEIVLVLVNGQPHKQRVDLSELSHWFDSQSRFLNLMTAEALDLNFSEGIWVDGWDVLILQFNR